MKTIWRRFSSDASKVIETEVQIVAWVSVGHGVRAVCLDEKGYYHAVSLEHLRRVEDGHGIMVSGVPIT